ncbi:Ig-like domain-containing protein [Erysipelothrix urinaevulpis]|uniref:Ig-like domain-containing protein n=1 Tax=Erysipelothrix urinaevulpis TaxID=2683717 RepID=UPI001358B380|nr:Ig-like domain-containing protein [Erysipelothrix urinaevulpis]
MKKIASLITLLALLISSFLSPVLLIAEDIDSDHIANNEPDDPKYLTIKKKKYTLEAFSSVPLEVETKGNGALRYKSENTAVVTVDNAGLMSAVSEGSTNVLVLYDYNGEIYEEEVSVTVLADKGSISFAKKEFFLIRGLSFDIEYKLDGGIKAHEIIWESSNPKVARVENGRVYGQGIGTATISASVRNVVAKMEVHVTVPLKGLEFNPTDIEIAVGETLEIPSLVYVPYDTTTKKSAKYSIEDPNIVSLDNQVITANKVGTTKIFAQINEVIAELNIKVMPKKSISGAHLVELTQESVNEQQITYHIPDMDIYGEGEFALSLPVDETIEFLKDKEKTDIFILLEDKMYRDNMKMIDQMIIDEKIMMAIKNQKVNVHLLNSTNLPVATYTFENSISSDIDLKYSLENVDEKDELYALTKTKTYYLKFKNKNGFPAKTTVKLPAAMMGNHYKQLHFIYEMSGKELLDTHQEVMIDHADLLEIDIVNSDYLITFKKIAQTDDSTVIKVLSIALFVSLLSGFGIYYTKAHYKKK